MAGASLNRSITEEAARTLGVPRRCLDAWGDRWPITFSRNLAPDFTHYLSERPEMSSQDESSQKAKPTRKKSKMEQKEAKKTIKVSDLKPTKDAKGGRKQHRRRQTTVNDWTVNETGAGKWDY